MSASRGGSPICSRGNIRPPSALKVKPALQFHASCSSSAYPTPGGPVPMSETLRSLVHNICHDDVTGRLNVVNWPPDHCAAHPLIVQMHSPLSLSDAATQGLVH